MNTQRKLWIPLVVTVLTLSAAAGAQDVDPPDVTHDESELSALLEEPAEPPTVDTALVFSSFANEELRVVCRARNAQGEPIGHAGVRVPAQGVRFLLASDFSEGAPFLGQVRCLAPRGIRGTGFARSANGITVVPSPELKLAEGRAILFPVVATR